MINSIDSWLIDRIFQPISNFMQRLIGLNNFKLAYISCYLMILFGNMQCEFMPYDNAEFFGYMNIIGAFFLVDAVFAEKKYQLHDMPKKCLNSRRNNPYSINARVGGVWITAIMTSLTLISFSWISFFGILWLASMAITAYFSACTPMPPKKTWLKMGAEFLKKKLTPAPKESPLPDGLPA